MEALESEERIRLDLEKGFSMANFFLMFLGIALIVVRGKYPHLLTYESEGLLFRSVASLTNLWFLGLMLWYGERSLVYTILFGFWVFMGISTIALLSTI